MKIWVFVIYLYIYIYIYEGSAYCGDNEVNSKGRQQQQKSIWLCREQEVTTRKRMEMQKGSFRRCNISGGEGGKDCTSQYIYIYI